MIWKAGGLCERVSHPPTDRNIIAILDSVSADNGGAESSVLKRTLRTHWNPQDYQPATLEKTMKLRFYNGVMNFLRRELERVCKHGNEGLGPLHIESEFEVPGEVVTGDSTETYLLRGVFDRIEGY